MSRKKLTLSVDEVAIRKARRYSKRHHTSISELVTRFLRGLDVSGIPSDAPIVDSLRGIVPNDTDIEEYRDYLVEKYEDE